MLGVKSRWIFASTNEHMLAKINRDEPYQYKIKHLTEGRTFM